MTKEFKPFVFDHRKCQQEAEELRALLATKSDLQERKDVLPFFKQRLHLSAFLGSYHPDIVRYDLVAHELPLFGDFVADLVVGDSQNNAFAFIEFEDAAPGSIFVRKRGTKAEKATPDWSSRFEHGFSQLVDWFFKLHDQEQTTEFEEKFGSRTIRHIGILVIGRAEHLGKRETQRLRWRQEFVLLNSKQIHCKTFDQLCDDLLARLEQFSIAARIQTRDQAEGASSAQTPSKIPEVSPPADQNAPSTRDDDFAAGIYDG